MSPNKFNLKKEMPKGLHNYTKFLCKHKPLEGKKNSSDVHLNACFPADYL